MHETFIESDTLTCKLWPLTSLLGGKKIFDVDSIYYAFYLKQISFLNLYGGHLKCRDWLVFASDIYWIKGIKLDVCLLT